MSTLILVAWESNAGTLTTSLAALRRDGFASMDSGEARGTLTTRPVRFSGKHLFVNVADPKGELRVEVSEPGRPGIIALQCRELYSCNNRQNPATCSLERCGRFVVAHESARPLSLSFEEWPTVRVLVSPEKTGASQGYVAAGGPGLSSNRDTGR